MADFVAEVGDIACEAALTAFDRGPAHLGIIDRELPMHPRQIKDRSNLANEVIVRNSLIKME